MKSQSNITFCENETCDVILYQSVTDQGDNVVTNCPGCGRFGRLKNTYRAQIHVKVDRPPEQQTRPIKDNPQA